MNNVRITGTVEDDGYPDQPNTVWPVWDKVIRKAKEKCKRQDAKYPPVLLQNIFHLNLCHITCLLQLFLSQDNQATPPTLSLSNRLHFVALHSCPHAVPKLYLHFPALFTCSSLHLFIKLHFPSIPHPFYPLLLTPWFNTIQPFFYIYSQLNFSYHFYLWNLTLTKPPFKKS